MRTKIVILVLALALGGLAAFTAARYLSDARSEIVQESEAVAVLVAKEDIPRGLTAEELLNNGLIALEEVPRRFVAAGAVSSEASLQGHVLASPLTAGEQVTLARFELPEAAGVSYSIPKDHVAISIPVDVVTGVSGLVKPGDHIALYVNLEKGPGEEEGYTRLLVADAKVVASGGALRAIAGTTESEPQAGIGATRDDTEGQAIDTRTLTVSVTPVDAERIVWAASQGEVWAAVLPAVATAPPASKGQTVETVFK